jgi:hypothetical protein
MASNDQPLIVQISRGMAPAASIAHAVDASHTFRAPYELISGKPAAEAKNAAARMAFDRGLDLLLIEDDIIATPEMWRTVLGPDRRQMNVAVASALMRNGQLNTWFHGLRLCYSGTVFLFASHAVLAQVGDPWFAPRNLWFSDANGGEWIDSGPNANGLHSDVWFFYRLWQEGVEAEILGSVVHLIHEYNNTNPRLAEPSMIHPLGIVTCTKMEGTHNE